MLNGVISCLKTGVRGPGAYSHGAWKATGPSLRPPLAARWATLWGPLAGLSPPQPTADGVGRSSLIVIEPLWNRCYRLS